MPTGATGGPPNLPYPNLGPEPMPGAYPAWGWPILFGSLAVLILGALAVRAARSHSRRGGSRRADEPDGETKPRGGAVEGSEVIALAGTVRGALVGRFGESWRAKTTEEIAASDELAAVLGSEGFGRLVSLFVAADLAKFARSRTGDGGRPAPDQGDEVDWPASTRELLASLRAGARSMTTG